MPVRELVEEALSRIPEPYSEHITHDVFRVIENDEGLLRQYHETAEEDFRQNTWSLNKRIGRFVKDLTGRESGGRGEFQQPALARSYTKLVER